MSQQDENQVLTPQELREALLSELETNRQELAELNDEQLAEIVGEVLDGNEIKEICCMRYPQDNRKNSNYSEGLCSCEIIPDLLELQHDEG